MLKFFTLFLRFAFALLLMSTGIGKLLDVPGFVEVANDYDVLPRVLLWPSALLMIGAEIGISIWLLSGRKLRTAALATCALHLVFVFWVSVALLRGLEIANCGCFGVFWARPLTHWTFVEDLSMTVLSYLLFHFSD